MVITKTPFRISFFGGGTDYPDWYKKEGGAVLSTTIDKYCYIHCRYLPPFFAIKHRIVWSKIETVNSISEISHPAIKGALNYLGFDENKGVEIQHMGDLPARTGIGSSSSFAVGIIKALMALKGKIINKHDLAMKAIELEQKVLKESVGSQDQVAAAYGGFNVIYFNTNGEIKVEPISISGNRIKELEKNLLMVYTGSDRYSFEIAGTIIQNLQKKSKELYEMRQMVDKAVSILNSDTNMDEFGSLLHETWIRKREISSSVSNQVVDNIYSIGLNNGALGGKLLGAGAAGFMLFYVREENRAKLIKSLSEYLVVPFHFDYEGSSVIYYEQNFE